MMESSIYFDIVIFCQFWCVYLIWDFNPVIDLYKSPQCMQESLFSGWSRWYDWSNFHLFYQFSKMLDMYYVKIVDGFE